MKFILILLLLCSCLNNEGGINIYSSNDDNKEPSTPNNNQDPITDNTSNQSSSQNEIHIDFTDSSELGNHFTTYIHDGSFAQNVASTLISGTAGARCSHGGTHSSCNFKTIQTFNLPITIEIETSAYNTHSSGTRWGVTLYEGVASRWSEAYDNPQNGTNYGSIIWEHVSSKFIRTWGIFGEQMIANNLTNHGKVSVNILADLSYTITYTEYDNSGNYLNEHTATGTLSTTPQNFHVEIYQSNFSSTGYFDIDNMKIIYE